VEPKVANMLRSRNGNIIEEDRRAVPTTELEGDVGTLGMPLTAPALDTGEVVLKDLKSGVRFEVTGEYYRMSWHVGSIGLDIHCIGMD
jgi:hypothetical protein